MSLALMGIVVTQLARLQGQAYTDAGATAYDAVDGAITSVSVSGLSAINTMVVSPQDPSPVNSMDYFHRRLMLMILEVCSGMMQPALLGRRHSSVD